MPVADARDNLGLRTIPVIVIFSTPGSYVSAFSWSEYSFNCTETLPPSQWVSVLEEYVGFDIDVGPLVRRFPNPVPEGIRVPYWALLDVTVRY